MMRWIILTLLTGMISLSANEPAEAAFGFLRDLKKDATVASELDRFAISPFCGPLKKELIQTSWEDRATWLEENDYTLSILSSTIEANLAGVIVGAATDENPESTTVLSIGVVKQEGAWKIAPVEGRFDNTGLGFDLEVGERKKSLEQWMSRAKVNGLTVLQSKERDRFRKKMLGRVKPETLKVEDPEEAILHFLKAAHDGEVDALLVWQGILERDQLPARDWDRSIRATQVGMASEEDRSAWRVLKSNKVMKVVVEGQGDSEAADYLVAFLGNFRTDPKNLDLNAVRFHLDMTDAGWRIRLPAFFSYDDDDLGAHRRAFSEEFDWEDTRTARQIGYVFEMETDKIRGDDPKAFVEMIVDDLGKGAIGPFLQKLYREEEGFDEDGEVEEEEPLINGKRRKQDIDDRRVDRYRSAVQWWAVTLGRGRELKTRIHKIYHEGDVALGVFAYESRVRSWKPELQTVLMAREEGGWMVLPDEDDLLSRDFDPALEGIRKKLFGKFEADNKKFEEDAPKALLKGLAIYDAKGSSIEKAAGLALAKEWRETARKGSVEELVAKSAVRKALEKPTALLKILGYLRTEAEAGKDDDQILGSKAVGRFLGISMMVDKGAEIERDCPLLIVVPTKNGHRVLLDIELPLESNKGIKLLNADRLITLADELSPDDLAAIKELHQWHQQLARSVWERWRKEQAAKKK